MHVLIDDFAWIAIALAGVTVVFMVSAAYILLEEAFKAVSRVFRRLTGTSYAPLQINRRISATQSYFSEPATGRESAVPFILGLRKLAAELGRVLQEKFEEAKAGFNLRLRLRHNKP